MGQAERRSRLQAMGAYVNGHDVFAWAASALADATGVGMSGSSATGMDRGPGR